MPTTQRPRTLEETGVSRLAAQAEIDRVLADPRFRVSDRNRAFLRHVADALFSGKADTVKAYSIAVDVFGRPEGFDASVDPIVRIEATRLRTALEQYYQAFGAPLGVRIELPRGNYIPLFLPAEDSPDTDAAGATQGQPAPPAGDAPVEGGPNGSDDDAVPADAASDADPSVGQAGLPDPAPAEPPPTPIGRPPRWFVIGPAVAACAGLALVAMLRAPPAPPPYVEKPLVELVLDHDAPPSLHEMVEDVLVAVGHFSTIRPRLKLAGGQAELMALPEQADYLVTFEQGAVAGAPVRWRIAAAPSTEVVAAGQSLMTAHGGGAAAADLARRIAGGDSVITMTEARRTLPDDALGNACYLHVEMAIHDLNLTGMDRLRGCLERTLQERPDDVDAHAGLAQIGIWDGRTGKDQQAFAAAFAHAARAFRLDPLSIRAGVALMAAQYHMRQHESAILTGRHLVSLNPENNLLLARVGLDTFLSGDTAAGLAYARQAEEMSDRVPRDVGTVYALDAFLRADYPAAVAAANRLAMDDPGIAMIRLLTLAMMQDGALVGAELQSATLRHPDLPRVAAAMRGGDWTRPDLRVALSMAFDRLEAGASAPAGGARR